MYVPYFDDDDIVIVVYDKGDDNDGVLAMLRTASVRTVGLLTFEERKDKFWYWLLIISSSPESRRSGSFHYFLIITDSN